MKVMIWMGIFAGDHYLSNKTQQRRVNASKEIRKDLATICHTFMPAFPGDLNSQSRLSHTLGPKVRILCLCMLDLGATWLLSGPEESITNVMAPCS